MESGVVGLAALGFWMFVAAAVVAGVWDGIRKREAEHETLRRIIESGKQPDQALIDKLVGYNDAPDSELKVAGLIVIFAAPGLAILGWFLGKVNSNAFMVLLGVSMLVACVGIGLLTAAHFMKKAHESRSSDNTPTIR